MTDRRGGRSLVTLVALIAWCAAFAATGGTARAATDTDGDGLPNSFETDKTRTDPKKKDTDGDGLRDDREDPDRDTLTNRQEYLAKTHPRTGDTDRDRRPDWLENLDGDAIYNRTEFRAGTHPAKADSDGDGIGDGQEDPDGDGLSNRQEQDRKTHPGLPDTDEDGYPDGIEASAGTSPRDPDDHPQPEAGDIPLLPGAPDCPILSASNVWNTRIDGRSVAADSATMISAIGLDRGLHMDFGSYAGYGIPYQVVHAATPRSEVTFEYDDESDHVGYPIPPSPLIEGAPGSGGDRHILLVERDECRLYELFAAELIDGDWHAGSGATWDLDSNALRPQGWTSADAAGLPILPGLVRYDEVDADEIGHALRFTTNRTRTAYIYPARHQAGSSGSTSLPPMGLRVRLKASYDISGFPPHARAIARALQRYGMILADNGSPWYISGMSDPRFDDDVLHELDVITGADLEVVDTTGLVNGS